MAAMMLGRVSVLFTLHPGIPFRFADQFFGFAQRDAIFFRKAFRAFGYEHHVRALFENGACGTDGIFYVAQRRSSAGAQRKTVHHDGIALDMAVEIQMRAVSRIEDWVVFEDD